MGYAAGPSGPSGRWWPALLAGLVCVGLVAGRGRQPLPVPVGMPSDQALLARDADAGDVRSLRFVYRDALGRVRTVACPVPTALRHVPSAAWARAFPGWQTSRHGRAVTLTEQANGRPFTLALAHGRVVLLAGDPRYGAVVLETLPFLGGTLPLNVRAQLSGGVRVRSVADAWRAMDAWLT